MHFQSVNGEKIDQVSILDRGLAYGDGLFTTAKITNGFVQMLDQHIERLNSGCLRLRIQGFDSLMLKAELIDIASFFDVAVLKIIVTSGEGGRGYSRNGISKPNIIIKTSDYPKKYDDWKKSGISVSNASIKLGLNPLYAGIKHLNRLEQVMLRDELEQTAHDDLFVYDLNGMLVETTCANIFWLQNGKLFTPKIKNSGVAGLLRAEIIKYIPDTQIVSTDNTLINADAIFITNSVMGIVPVLQHQGKQFDIDKVHQFSTSFKSLTHD